MARRAIKNLIIVKVNLGINNIAAASQYNISSTPTITNTNITSIINPQCVLTELS